MGKQALAYELVFFGAALALFLLGRGFAMVSLGGAQGDELVEQSFLREALGGLGEKRGDVGRGEQRLDIDRREQRIAGDDLVELDIERFFPIGVVIIVEAGGDDFEQGFLEQFVDQFEKIARGYRAVGRGAHQGKQQQIFDIFFLEGRELEVAADAGFGGGEDSVAFGGEIIGHGGLLDKKR